MYTKIIITMELRDYSVQNVRWKRKEYIKSDKHIKDYSEKKYQWVPEILKEAKQVPGNIYTLRGPRQVGKIHDDKYPVIPIHLVLSLL